MLEWSQGSAEGEVRGVTKALAFPKGCNGFYIPLGRDTTNSGYSKLLSTLCRHRYYGVGTHRSVAKVSVILD